MSVQRGLGSAVAARLLATGAVSDPVGWAQDRLGAHLWSKQREIIESVRDNRHTAVQSCHGAGKSYVSAVTAAHWIDSHPIGDAFVLTTASTAHQVEGILWRELGKLHIRAGLHGGLTGGPVPMWKIAGEIVGIGRKPADDDQEGLQGWHARYLLAIVDEASGVSAGLFDAIDSLATNEHARILAIGNPLDPGSHFASICKPGSGWNRIKISALDLPAFTGEPVPDSVAEHLTGRRWVEERAKRWGETSPAYVSRVLGEFPDISDDTLISPASIFAAQERDLTAAREVMPAGVLGCDVARTGNDKTVIYRNHDGVLRLEHQAQGHDLMRTTGEVARRLRDRADLQTAAVDEIGLGGGVVDRLREQGISVIAFNSSSAPYDRVRFANRRAEVYWQLKEAFERGTVDLDPNDDELAAQLGAIRFTIDSRGRILIESKEAMRKRGLPSPDRADAAVMAFAAQRHTGSMMGLGLLAREVGRRVDSVPSWENLERQWARNPLEREARRVAAIKRGEHPGDDGESLMTRPL